jgi:hypothetical protein
MKMRMRLMMIKTCRISMISPLRWQLTMMLAKAKMRTEMKRFPMSFQTTERLSSDKPRNTYTK